MLIELSGGNITEYKKMLLKIEELYNSYGISSEGGFVINTIKGEDYSEVKKLRVVAEFRDFKFYDQR